MKNVTITLDEEAADWARDEAARTGKSLSRYVADLIGVEQERARAEQIAAMDALLARAARIRLAGEPQAFDREDIYDEALSRLERGDREPRSARSSQAKTVLGVAEGGGQTRYNPGEPASMRRNAKRRRPKARD
jgi:hypothetical protein